MDILGHNSMNIIADIVDILVVVLVEVTFASLELVNKLSLVIALVIVVHIVKAAIGITFKVTFILVAELIN